MVAAFIAETDPMMRWRAASEQVRPIEGPAVDRATIPHGTRSIEWHLAVLCTALAVPMLGLVGWLLWQYTGAERQRLDRQRLDTLDQVVVSVERDLALLKAVAELAASAPLLASGNEQRSGEKLR